MIKRILSFFKRLVLFVMWSFWLMISLFAIVFLWKYSAIGMEFFLPGTPTTKLIFRVILFVLVGVYCAYIGNIWTEAWQVLKSRGDNVEENEK